MPGTFTYTVATNTVVVTGGTALAPATFADFVAQDRSGTGTSLKAAAVAAAGMTLTYPVRPVEQKALRLTFTTAAAGGAAVSGDEKIDIYGTTGAWTTFSASEAAGQTVLSVTDASIFAVGDIVRLIDISAPATTETAIISAVSIVVGANTITVGAITNAYIAGDIVGIAQTETISTAAAHAAYVTSFPFGQVAYFDCTGYDGTNTVAVTQPIWGVISAYVTNGLYRIHANFDIGDASTATTFVIGSGEQVRGDSLCNILQTTANATLTVGTLDTYGLYGTSIYIEPKASYYCYLNYGGTVNIYCSQIIIRQNYATTGYPVWFTNGTGGSTTIKNSQIIAAQWYNNWRSRITFAGTGGTLTLENVYFSGFSSGIEFYRMPDTFVNCWVHKFQAAGYLFCGAGTLQYGNMTGAGTSFYINLSVDSAYTVVMLDPLFDLVSLANTKFSILNAGSILKASFTVAINVSDKDGTDLSGATVTWVDSQSNTGNDDTDVNGDVSFTLTAKQWVGTAETETDFNTFTFTISKAGYETLTLENITIDSAIDWHLELQAPPVSPTYNIGV